MGYVASTAWVIAGIMVLVGAVWAVPEDLREIASGFGVRDAITTLVGSLTAAVAGVAAVLAGIRLRDRRWPAAAIAFPAVLLATAIVWSFDVLGPARAFPSVSLLASLFGLFILPFLLPYGLAAWGAVLAIDALVELASAERTAAP